MADLIRHKRSATAAAVPSAGQLQLGELAVNVEDGVIYLKKADGSVVAYGRDISVTGVQTASELSTGATDVLLVSPAAPSQAIFLGRFSQAVYAAAANITGGGHIIGSLGNAIVMATAGNVPQVIGNESRVDVYAGYVKTIGEIKAQLALLSLAGGTHPLAVMFKGEAAIQAGVTLAELRGHDVQLIAQLGTVGKLTGYHFPDFTGVSSISVRTAFEGKDPAAPILNAAPICEQSWSYATPSSGQNVAIPALVNDFQLIGGSRLASLTLTFPAPANTPDGMMLTVGSQMAITALTLAPNGSTILNGTTTVPAGGVVRYKFYGKGLNYWVKR